MEEAAGWKRPAGEGWFVVNAREAAWIHNEKFGAGVTFEGSPEFTQVGINIQVMWPGQPNGYYHGEGAQEDFLVLRGACLLLVEGEERRLKPGTSSTVRPAHSTFSWAPGMARVCSSGSAHGTPVRGSCIRCPSSRCVMERA